MMLKISRRMNETITIEPICGLDPELTLREAFEQGPIEIRLVRVSRSKACLAIDAPQELKIWRGFQPPMSEAGEPAKATADAIVRAIRKDE